MEEVSASQSSKRWNRVGWSVDDQRCIQTVFSFHLHSTRLVLGACSQPLKYFLYQPFSIFFLISILVLLYLYLLLYLRTPISASAVNCYPPETMVRSSILAVLAAITTSALSMERRETPDLYKIELGPNETKLITEAEKWVLKSVGHTSNYCHRYFYR
jgi:hypothetical protein